MKELFKFNFDWSSSMMLKDFFGLDLDDVIKWSNPNFSNISSELIFVQKWPKVVNLKQFLLYATDNEDLE